MGRLTTHVLDTTHGCPGQGIVIKLLRIDDGDRRQPLVTMTTNADGRVDQPLLEGDALQSGEYELIFHAGDYFAARGVEQPSPRFLDRVAIRFGISDPSQHYHVPLLISPYSYSTYRGS